MPGFVLGLATALAIALAAPRAQASGRGGGGGYYPSYPVIAIVGISGIAILGADVVLTALDVGRVVNGQPASIGHGVFETLLAAPQVAFGISEMNGSPSGAWTGYTLWMGALAVHGIWSVAAGVHAGAAGETPGTANPASAVQIRFGPTYAPVGQMAHPGFGLVVRF
ncbi:MAG TPA: hypothetical protein VLT85_01475 [Terriglobales bacterium]|nr:hypothetical protein [Terriglobales bacterium]